MPLKSEEHHKNYSEKIELPFSINVNNDNIKFVFLGFFLEQEESRKPFSLRFIIYNKKESNIKISSKVSASVEVNGEKFWLNRKENRFIVSDSENRILFLEYSPVINSLEKKNKVWKVVSDSQWLGNANIVISNNKNNVYKFPRLPVYRALSKEKE